MRKYPRRSQLKRRTCSSYQAPNSEHIKELNNARPKQPFFFLKPPSSILLPKSGPFLKPKGVSVHYEVELGLVIGKTVRDLKEGDTQGWMDAIEGEFDLPHF
jgi:acylpyruvate hydrolase